MKKRVPMAMLAITLVASTILIRVHAAQADSKPSGMQVGIVNMMRILADTPEYQQKSEEYMDERKKLFDPGAAKNQKDFQALLIKRKPEIEAAEKKWDKIKGDFITQATDKIRTASEQVMADKHLTFVLEDAPWNPEPLRQYGAVDITTDVLLAMKNTK